MVKISRAQKAENYDRREYERIKELTKKTLIEFDEPDALI